MAPAHMGIVATAPAHYCIGIVATAPAHFLITFRCVAEGRSSCTDAACDVANITPGGVGGLSSTAAQVFPRSASFGLLVPVGSSAAVWLPGFVWAVCARYAFSPVLVSWRLWGSHDAVPPRQWPSTSGGLRIWIRVSVKVHVPVSHMCGMTVWVCAAECAPQRGASLGIALCPSYREPRLALAGCWHFPCLGCLRSSSAAALLASFQMMPTPVS